MLKAQQFHASLLKLSSSSPTDHRSWNLVLSRFIRAQQPTEALTHFILMTRSPVQPDNFTYSTIIPCCDIHAGRQIHARLTKSCSESDPFIGTNLVRMYSNATDLNSARQLFDEMPERDPASYNAIISIYSKFGMGRLSLSLFQKMVRDGVRSDEFTFATVLNDFVKVGQIFGGMQLHSLIVKGGFSSDHFTCNALLGLYSKCGFVGSATKLLDEIGGRDVVSWTSMITGLTASGRERDAFEDFRRMRMLEVVPNTFTFGSLVGSCASTSSLEMGKQLHALVLKYGLEGDVVLGSAMVDMYSKSGEMDDAVRIFRSLREKDRVSWNVMICGLAQNGKASEALQVFDEMVGLSIHQSSVTPDSVTFIGALTACSRGGLVDKSCKLFVEMVQKYSIEPLPEHYACIVDSLGRAGCLEEAESIVLALPFAPDAVIWGALLAACKRKRHMAMARRITKRLFMNEPTDSSNYVLLANMHSDIGEWDNAREVREVMCMNVSSKEAGRSWIEMKGLVRSFVSGHTHMLQHELIYEALHGLRLHIVEEGYK